MSPCLSLQPTLASAGVVGAGLIWGKPLPQDGIEDRVYRSGTVLSMHITWHPRGFVPGSPHAGCTTMRARTGRTALLPLARLEAVCWH